MAWAHPRPGALNTEHSGMTLANRAAAERPCPYTHAGQRRLPAGVRWDGGPNRPSQPWQSYEGGKRCNHRRDWQCVRGLESPA